MSTQDVAIIVMTVTSVLGMGCVYLARALEETRRSAPPGDDDFPPLDYRQHRKI